MMTTHDALLRSILSAPDDDLPRLVYADLLEESGDAARAEFVRVQCELTRIDQVDKTCPFIEEYNRTAPVPGAYPVERWTLNLCQCRGCEIMRTARRLMRFDWFPISLPRTSLRIRGGKAIYIDVLNGDGLQLKATFSRGFISAITVPWQYFLRVHESLIWSPTQVVECPKCKGSGRAPFANEWQCWTCGKEGKRGAASGRVPRPFVPTAQPIREVVLTTWPEAMSDQPQHPHRDRVIFWDGPNREESMQVQFDRVKCETCDGQGSARSGWDERPICESCNGTPLNSWTCDSWPGITFKMPEATRAVSS